MKHHFSTCKQETFFLHGMLKVKTLINELFPLRNKKRYNPFFSSQFLNFSQSFYSRCGMNENLNWSASDVLLRLTNKIESELISLSPEHLLSMQRHRNLPLKTAEHDQRLDHTLRTPHSQCRVRSWKDLTAKANLVAQQKAIDE